MQMEWTYVIAVVITGLAVVFLALILLIVLISLFGKFFDSMEVRKQKKISDSQPAQTTPDVQETITDADVQDEDDDDETVAVIAAAIAMMGAGEGKNYKIKSVKPARSKKASGSSVWSAAGLRENTRPF
ncbi:MAG: OadG family transporter subunit [Oscillospiraceae bacterium]|nr:OadG family transporter subunit [Oscillospiraceae bacterium]